MAPVMSAVVYTIGHSNHPYPEFLGLLKGASIDVVLDIRSIPRSRLHPQFSRERLEPALAADGIAYLFLGDALGGRPRDPALLVDGRADYGKLSKAPVFQKGLERVLLEAGKRRAAMMCAEKDPLNCHRCRLVGRALGERGADDVRHILESGALISQAEIEESLIARLGGADLFSTRAERLEEAYGSHGRKRRA